MKLLLVEDNAQLRKTLFDYLHEEGFAVDMAADGDEGLYKSLNWGYDAIVLDLMIPAPDGFEILKQLRAAGHATPVILLTARGSLADRLQGLDGGADDYLVKPFEMAELLARIRAAVRRSLGAPSPLIRIGPILLNTVARSVELHGQAVELTAGEYSLLELLARRRDGIVSRAELYEHLFDEHEDSLSNLLDVYIYKLRQKLGKSFIQTRRGMGYRLSE